MTFSVPPKRAPERASRAAATASAAVWFFMSIVAAAVQEAVAALGAPRVGAPVLGVGEHGVDVREVAERRAVLAAAERGDEVRALRLGAVELDLQPGVREVVREPLLALALVAGRVDGAEADQRREDLGGLVLQLLGEAHGLERSGEARPARRRSARRSAATRSASATRGGGEHDPLPGVVERAGERHARRRGSRPPRRARRRRGTRARWRSRAGARSGGAPSMTIANDGAKATAVAASAPPSPAAA